MRKTHSNEEEEEVISHAQQSRSLQFFAIVIGVC